jgi:hypothetical protein
MSTDASLALASPNSTLSLLLNSELLRWLVKELVRFWRESRFQGGYRAESHHASLELMDRHGNTARYTKRQQVTFLQDGICAIQDQAWADGDIFADYRCSPGIAVDRYVEGYRWRILISMRATKNRGDTADCKFPELWKARLNSLKRSRARQRDDQRCLVPGTRWAFRPRWFIWFFICRPGWYLRRRMDRRCRWRCLVCGQYR